MNAFLFVCVWLCDVRFVACAREKFERNILRYFMNSLLFNSSWVYLIGIINIVYEANPLSIFRFAYFCHKQNAIANSRSTTERFLWYALLEAVVAAHQQTKQLDQNKAPKKIVCLS